MQFEAEQSICSRMTVVIFRSGWCGSLKAMGTPREVELSIHIHHVVFLTSSKRLKYLFSLKMISHTLKKSEFSLKSLLFVKTHEKVGVEQVHLLSRLEIVPLILVCAK